MQVSIMNNSIIVVVDVWNFGCLINLSISLKKKNNNKSKRSGQNFKQTVQNSYQLIDIEKHTTMKSK